MNWRAYEMDLNIDKRIAREEGLEEGREKGREEGREQGRIDAIRNMITLGVPKEKILTVYTEEEYEKAKISK